MILTTLIESRLRNARSRKVKAMRPGGEGVVEDPASRSPHGDRSSITLLGVRIDRYRLPRLVSEVVSAARCGHRLTVMYVNVHCMNLAHDDPAYRAILNSADIVYCDGTGVRLGARLADMPLPERMTGADWIEDLCHVVQREGLSLFLLGGRPGVAEDAAAALVARYPSLRIAGVASGFGGISDTIRELDRARPDIVLVGMGSPGQETWIDRHRPQIDAPVVWAVGALFDFVAGRIPRGPHWMTENGLEWLCRLAAEPRKLWRRYLIGNPRFLARVLLTYRLGSGR
jgi:N-acetylglucosaminyldiphosphoundecaprenol N-acetyl-beta-D-mannosaminyltransferase